MGAEVSATAGLAEVASPLVALVVTLPRLALSLHLTPLRGVALSAVALSPAFAATALRALACPRLASAWASAPTAITMTHATRGRRTATGGFAVTTTDVAAHSSESAFV